MAATRSLVVVARPDPSTTDALAERLRESCTVRTAYSTGDVLDRLDGEVDAVVVDPALSDDVVSTVREAVDDRGLACQVGLLTDATGRDVAAEQVDAVISPGTDDERVRETVEWLAMRATYRKALDEYYELAQASADLQRAGEAEGDGGDGARDLGDGTRSGDDVDAELDRLHGQIEGLRRRLDETAEKLDTLSLFEAALRRDRDE